ncbi:MAG: hypothetical protein SWH68_14575 [Thermodesulfobacteriota bacterium]|nr:hypothetical protein [Thermodesulfobacteriota bacterium]
MADLPLRTGDKVGIIRVWVLVLAALLGLAAAASTLAMSGNSGKTKLHDWQQLKQKLILLKKKKGELDREAILRVRFVPMVDKNGQAY